MSTTNLTIYPAHSEASSQGSTENDKDSVMEDTSPTFSMSNDLTDALFTHFSSNLPTRELLQLMSASKTWSSLISSNIMITAKARIEDDTKDWYFPLCFSKQPNDSRLWVLWDLSTWHGLHHASQEVQPLPPLPQLCSSPPTLSDPGTLLKTKFCKLNCLLASSGGLLLFADEGVPGSMYSLKSWRTLLVCNPITKAWRELPDPAVISGSMGRLSREYWGVQAHLVEDTRANSYHVILTFRERLFVYNSSSNSWKMHAFSQKFPWGSRCDHEGVRLISNFISVPSASLNGKLYYAELEIDGNVKPNGKDLEIRTRGFVRVFEVDYDSGTWKPFTRYALRNYFQDVLQNPLLDFGFGRKSYTMKIVTCMGVLFAIIPAGLAVTDMLVPVADLDVEVGMEMDEVEVRHADFLQGDDHQMMLDSVYNEVYIAPFLHLVDDVNHEIALEEDEVDLDEVDPDREGEIDPADSETERAYDCLPLQFYIVPLVQGGKLAIGKVQTEIQRPRRTVDVLDRLQWDFNTLVSQPGAANGEGFHCAARGSVIWLTWWDFLLQYDVVSGQSKCRTLPKKILPYRSTIAQPNLSFSPSFHMKP